MTKRARRVHSPAFKVKVAIAAIKGDRTLSELSQQFDVHPNQITAWKGQLLEGGRDVEVLAIADHLRAGGLRITGDDEDQAIGGGTAARGR